MSAKKFQVFVSSTYKDLLELRRSVMESVKSMNHFPVGMEAFSADDDEQWQIIREAIEETDYHVCIIGHRYGSVASDGRSFTEKEWDYAKELKIPIMTFIRDRNAPTIPSEREVDSLKDERLLHFIEKAQADKMVDFWSQADDLNTKVVTALYKAFSRKPRPGWMRAESAQVAEQLATVVEENRTLRIQIERLTSQAKDTYPTLEVLLNGANSLSLRYVSNEELLGVKLRKPIECEEVPDNYKRLVTKANVRDYNSRLPSRNDIQAWLAAKRALSTSKRLAVSVKNIGTAKARQVFADITFPQGVSVIRSEERAQIVLSDLNLPENSLEWARRELGKSKAGRKGNFGAPAVIHLSSKPFKDRSNVTTSVPPMQRDRSIKISDNTVVISVEALMHTREHSFSELLIVPYQRGKFEVRCSVICEEMSSPKEFVLPLTVSDKEAS